jgi:hypothetical protein
MAATLLDPVENRALDSLSSARCGNPANGRSVFLTEKHCRGDMEASAEAFDVVLVQFALALQDFGNDALGSKLGSKVLLPKIVGFYEFAQNFDWRGRGNSMVLFLVFHYKDSQKR